VTVTEVNEVLHTTYTCGAKLISKGWELKTKEE
jgi:hypothetical protein